jgi:hypothetical protein
MSGPPPLSRRLLIGRMALLGYKQTSSRPKSESALPPGTDLQGGVAEGPALIRPRLLIYYANRASRYDAGPVFYRAFEINAVEPPRIRPHIRKPETGAADFPIRLATLWIVYKC